MKLTIVDGKTAGIAETDAELRELLRMAEIQLYAPLVNAVLKQPDEPPAVRTKRKYTVREKCEICGARPKRMKMHKLYKHDRPRTADWFKKKHTQ